MIAFHIVQVAVFAAAFALCLVVLADSVTDARARAVLRDLFGRKGR